MNSKKDNQYYIEKYLNKDYEEKTIEAITRFKQFYFEFFSNEIDENLENYYDELNDIITEKNSHFNDHKDNLRTPYRNDGKEYKNIIIEDLDIDLVYELPNFTGTETEKEIKSTEKKLGFKLPHSLKTFLLNHGYFQTGEYCPTYFFMYDIKSYENIYETILSNHKVDVNERLDKESGDYLKRLYPIAVADSNHGNVYHCFDIDTFDPESGEMNFIYWHEDDWEITPPEYCPSKRFDKYISAQINEGISYHLHDSFCN